MAEPKPDGWPFLVVLTSPKGPRAAGLGCLIDAERVVTTARVAELASLALLADGAEVGITFDETGEAVAVGRLTRPVRVGLKFPWIVARPEDGASCTLASADVGAGRLTTHYGTIGLTGTEGDFGVELDEPIMGTGTAAGSPVLVRGHLVGVVHREVRDRWVDAFAVHGAKVDGFPVRVPPLAEGARAGLAVAAEMLHELKANPELVATAVLLGSLITTLSTDDDEVAGLLRRHHPEIRDAREVVHRAAIAAGIGEDHLALQTLPTERQLVALQLAQPLAAARTVARRTGAKRVHLRHVLATSLLAGAASPLPEALVVLGPTVSELREMTLRLVENTAPDEDPAAWAAVLRDPAAGFALAGGYSQDAVDPTVAIALEDDQLGVRDDATMLATVIADRATPMPLSIGLFGEWGSGKSTFMGLMRGQVDALATSGGDGYLPNIRQIGFNAWHYADTNLWASLGHEIFEQLAGPANRNTPEREALESELSARLHARKELEAATQRAKAQTARLNDEIDRAAARSARSAVKLARAAVASPAVKRELHAAFKRLGVHDEAEQGRRLAAELRGATIADDERHASLPWLGARGAAIVASVGIVAGALALLLERWVAGGGLAAAGALLATATYVVAQARSGLDKLRHATREIKHGLVKDELAALREAEASQQVLQAQLDEVIGRVGELGRELAELSPGRRLYSFVSERAGGEDYRRHLGLISTVRKDFQQLIALMDDWRKRAATDADAPLPIDRIVLYIDDLDRCSPRQVVDVLQAVHLLLALELFVVVVGVDPRWLLRSLQSQYDELLAPTEGNDDDSGWQASPQDYLEKIFNIPFALPDMSPASFGALLASLAREGEPPPARPDEDGQVPEDLTGDEVDEAVPAATPADPATIPAERDSRVDRTLRHEPQPAEARHLTDNELELLVALAPLVQTPREAKRLVNLYRMIRTTRDVSAASRFLGDDDRAGEYQAVVVLLGLLSGHAALLEDVLAASPGKADGGEVLGGLRHRARTTTWAEFVAGIEPTRHAGGWGNAIVGSLTPEAADGWRDLHRGLADATALVTLDDLEQFQLWAPRVARFSFVPSAYDGPPPAVPPAT